MGLPTIQSIINRIGNLLIRKKARGVAAGCEYRLQLRRAPAIDQIYENALAGLVIFGLAVVSSCVPLRSIEPGDVEPIVEDWIIPDGPVQVLRERTWNLHHQKLRVRFDFNQELVIGDTEMLFTTERSQSELIFDAKTMDFDSIYDVRSDRSFDYVQDSAVVTVNLDRQYLAGDTLVLGVSFVSNPPQRGLYFVNPRGEDPLKPTQIWTLGQPEDNSFWFPTIDHPAERATQETWISVPDNFQTLSNGLLLDSRVLPGDSLRTDYWRLHQPHTPYLFVLAVGEYEIIEEEKGDILYRYYIEDKYVDTVYDIYNNTDDMVDFIEQVTGVSYPWDPVYAQAPVHDFIARGMENTTATLLYDAVQFDKRAAQDLSNQDLIMHEVVHQWFGNLVTCKDWANLPLNEGFANYFESLYRRHSNGNDEYLWKNLIDRQRYFDEAAVYRRPLIFHNYEIPEDMYDRHTYQKGGQVLRMLHDYLGDDYWWQGVSEWLNRHAFDAVDVFDLQSVFEDVSGVDLYFFVEQWFLKPGHPYLEISHEIYGNRAVLNINQIHDTDRQPLFTLNPEVLIEYEGGSMRERIHVDDYENEFIFETSQDIIDIIVDPDRVLLAQYIRDISLSTLVQRLRSDHVLVRAEALSMAADFAEYRMLRDVVFELARADPFWGIRLDAYGFMTEYAYLLDPEEALAVVRHATFENEPKYQVRQQALNVLNKLENVDTDIKNAIQNHLIEMMDDTSYFVASEAIMLSGALFPEKAAEMIEPYAELNSYQDVIKDATATALIRSAGALQNNRLISGPHEELLRKLAQEPGDKRYSYALLSFVNDNHHLYEELDREWLASLFEIRLEDPYVPYRLLAYQALSRIGDARHLVKMRDILKKNDMESNERRALKDAIRVLEYDHQFKE